MLTETTAKVAGGTYLTKTYAEILHPAPEETRTADEIIHQVLHGLMDD